MTERAARRIAKIVHERQQTSAGSPQFDHVQRVAAAVPPPARVTAWLHDVLERTDVTLEQLRANGISSVELIALTLLTRADEDDYQAYVQRIADAPGQPGALARVVKLADLEDHLANPPVASPSTPPYSWARSTIMLVHAPAVSCGTQD